MESGNYDVFGEYLFPGGNRGIQKGRIEVLEDFRLVGLMHDENDKRSEITGTHPKIVMGYVNSNMIYFVKTPLRNAHSMPIFWRLRLKRHDFCEGSWIAGNGLLLKNIGLVTTFSEMNEKKAIESVKKGIGREMLENLFYIEREHFDLATEARQTGFLDLTKIG